MLGTLGSKAFYNSEVTSHEDTQENISAAGLIIGRAGTQLFLDEVGTLLVHLASLRFFSLTFKHGLTRCL